MVMKANCEWEGMMAVGRVYLCILFYLYIFREKTLLELASKF